MLACSMLAGTWRRTSTSLAAPAVSSSHGQHDASAIVGLVRVVSAQLAPRHRRAETAGSATRSEVYIGR